MPQACPACNHGDQAALLAALLCGESFYSIGKRFGLSAMSVKRHLENHLLGVVAWRERSLNYGPRVIRKQLQAFVPFAAIEIADWLRGSRPAKIEPKPDLRELKNLSRRLKALEESI